MCLSVDSSGRGPETDSSASDLNREVKDTGRGVLPNQLPLNPTGETQSASGRQVCWGGLHQLLSIIG